MALGKLDGLDPDTAFSLENVDEINEMFAKDGFKLTLADLETVFQKQFIHEHLLSADSHRDEEQEETTKKKRGRPKLTRLFEKIRDSRVCQLFSKVMNKMKSKLEATIEWLNQFIVCFLTSIGDIVKEDAYGRITHYREMLEEHLHGWKLPTARTIQYGYDWLRNKNKEKEDTAKTRQKRRKWRKMCDRITALLCLEPDLKPAIA